MSAPLNPHQTPARPAPSQPIGAPWPNAAAAAAIALIALGLAWELVLDPLRPGGSWLALKVLPLIIALKGLYQGRPYTFKWMSLAIWFYVGEGLVRILGLTSLERTIAWVYLLVSLLLSAAILMGARAHQRSIKLPAVPDGPDAGA